ncbi:hypothetical protein Hbl1158_06900 [Halobaculum sp. CBA1158]|uniref:DUF5789 family protein n=1 Tax=Halobaculum sp. CBA1158 TaxID=2904243 RepID=UPI001F16F7C0|nr:hypothetical protein [Halobaculum sp. CBA1158]UIP01074.1 hypothetical protein Hbl1158_06900 [Halobaculum sp. CBA1158]
MAARPPQGDTSEPDSIEFGIAALNARLDRAGVRFPATTDELIESLGDTEVSYDAAGNTLDVASVLREIPEERFESERDLLNRLHPIFEDRRRSGAGSLLGRVRSILPF